MNDYSSFICNSSKLEKSQLFFNRWMNKLWHMESYSVIKCKNIDIYNSIDISQNYYVKWKRLDIEYIWYESIFIKLKMKTYLYGHSRSVLPGGEDSWVDRWQRLQKACRSSRSDGLLTILNVVMASWVYTYIKISHHTHSVFIVCLLPLNKTVLRRKKGDKIFKEQRYGDICNLYGFKKIHARIQLN